MRIFFISSLLHSPAVLAQYFCVDLLSITPHVANNVLGELRLNLFRPVVSQCRGSCYFEGGLGQIENAVSNAMKKRVYISRPLMMKSLLLIRTNQFLSTLGPQYVDLASLYGVEHIKRKMEIAEERAKEEIDILSAGTPGTIYDVVNHPSLGLRASSKPTALSTYFDNKAIQEMYDFARTEIFKAYRQMILPSNVKVRSEIQKKTRQILTSEFDRILKKYNLLKTTKLPKFVYRITGTDFQFDERKKRFTFSMEKLITDQLNTLGETTISYFHVKEYSVRNGKDAGYLKLPEGEQLKALSDFGESSFKEGLVGYHDTSLVDILRDPEGRISHLVVRQSWGSRGATNHGYMYISVEYLLHFRFGNLVHWKVLTPGLPPQ